MAPNDQWSELLGRVLSGIPNEHKRATQPEYAHVEAAETKLRMQQRWGSHGRYGDWQATNNKYHIKNSPAEAFRPSASDEQQNH